jgi:hypothetical protein
MVHAGVMPEGFDFPGGAIVWYPIYQFTPEPLIASYGRLAPGATIDQLRAAIAPIDLTPPRYHDRPKRATALAELVAATALLLLVAWTQVAGLLLARYTVRLREIGVRLALGATRTALLRQFAFEAALIVIAVLALAWFAAPSLVVLILRILPPELTVGQHLAPDPRTFLFASMPAAIGIGGLAVLPIDLIRRVSPVELLRGGSVAALGVRASHARTWNFVVQFAMSMVLVYVTGLAVRSYVYVNAVPLGFSAERLLAIRMPRRRRTGRTLAIRRRGTRNAQRATAAGPRDAGTLAELPAVEHVAGSHQFPMQPNALSPTQRRPNPIRCVARSWGVKARFFPAIPR